MRLPDRQDFLDYAEGAYDQDKEVQKQILNFLASSSVMREQLAELKKDLYMVGSQIPDYSMSSTFAAEVSKLSQTWAKLMYERKFSLRQFYRSREFFYLMIFVSLILVFVLSMVGVGILFKK